MTVITATIIDQAGSELGGFLPRLGGALVLLIVGLIAARIIAWILRRVLTAISLDELAERWQVHDALERIGLPRSLTKVLSTAVRIGISLVVIFAALSLLGLQFLSESLNAAVLLLPKLLVAVALLIAGIVLGGFVRERVDRTAEQMDLPVPLGLFAQITVVAIFAITAAAQIAVSSAILLVIVAIVLAAALGSLGLAFGLGGKDIARALNAGRLVAQSFEIGQTIRVGELRGEIVGLEPAATLLRTDTGTVRVPNSLLIESPVTIGDDGGPPPEQAAAKVS